MSSSKLAVFLIALVVLVAAGPSRACALADSRMPDSPTKLVFIHHSTGQAWLEDGYGNLGVTMRDNRYFVSDTNYGWGPGSIGDYTDTGHWWTWFRGSSATTYTTALFAENGQNSSYSRLTSEPAGPNKIVMFKSCFPNSNIEGSPSDVIPPIETNPLKGDSGPLTVGNAKGIYLDLLPYFATQTDTMFVLVVPPPLRPVDTSAPNAANARYLANWLVDRDGWLAGYAGGNVVAYDYYTVLTGGHHRVSGGMVEHKAGASNYLAFPTGDSHPSAAGDRIASAEFAPFLNAALRSWQAGNGANLTPTTPRACVLTAPSVGATRINSTRSYRWRGWISPWQIGTGFVAVDIQRKSGGAWRWYATKYVPLDAATTSWATWFRIRLGGSYRLRTRHADADHLSATSGYRFVTVR